MSRMSACTAHPHDPARHKEKPERKEREEQDPPRPPHHQPHAHIPGHHLPDPPPDGQLGEQLAAVNGAKPLLKREVVRAL